jgi:hypothetical protein
MNLDLACLSSTVSVSLDRGLAGKLRASGIARRRTEEE